MKLIIDIPEEDYNFIKEQIADGITNPLKVCIANGIPIEQELKTDYKAFAEWVAEEIIDEENWKYNADAFPELACRKLNKLGVIDTDGKRWIYENEPLEQEPKTGHWIEKSNIYGVAYCSECGYELKIDNTNYCPNCGARMESEG